MRDPVIRLLTNDDLDAALALSATAGWNQRLEDWGMLLRLAPAGSFAALSDGRVIGTAIGIDYGGFGWIAMMLVDPAFRGRGVGGRLLDAAIGALPSDRPIRLDATPLGRPLYERYGFKDETLITRHVADASSGRAVSAVGPRDGRPPVRRLTTSDLKPVREQDTEVFGGNRRAVLEWALNNAPHYGHVVTADGPPHYSFGREGRLFDQIGPVVAGDDDAACALVSAALVEAGDRPVVVDAFDSRRTFAAWLRGRGFHVQRPLFRMCRPAGGAAIGGRNPPVPGTPGRFVEFAILGPEFG